MFGDEENAAIENFSPAASDIAAADVVKPEPVPGVDAPATPQPETAAVVSIEDAGVTRVTPRARFDFSADESGATVWGSRGQSVAEFNAGDALTTAQAADFATELCARLNAAAAAAEISRAEPAQAEQLPKTDAEIFLEHNQHDADGNCVLPSAQRCECGPCKRADGREKEV